MFWLSIIVLSAIIAYVLRVIPIQNTAKHYHVSINSFSVLRRLTLEYLNGNIPHHIFWFYYEMQNSKEGEEDYASLMRR